MTGLQRALLVLGLVGLAEGLAGLGLMLVSDHVAEPVAVTLMRLLVGWAFVGVGLYAWLRRPDNRVGAIMVAVGLTWFLYTLTASNQAGFYTAGLLVWHVCLPLSFTLLAFPTGRILFRRERLLIVAAWIWAVPFNMVIVLFDGAPIPGDTPQNLVAVTTSGTATDVARAAWAVTGATLAAWLLTVIVLRWRDSTDPQRRELMPILVPGALSAAFLGSMVVLQSLEADATALDLAQGIGLIAMVGLPFGFLVGLVRAHVVAGRAVGELVGQLGSVPPSTAGLRDALARSLRDPSLEVAYWEPEARRWLDGDGRPAGLPAEGSGRSWTPVERDGVPVAAIIHDTALDREAGVVTAAGHAAGLALENARLEAELRARVTDLEASRARIIAIGDEERRRLERDLHDGAQQRLVSLALRLRLARGRVDDASAAAEALDGAMDELREALDEVRELARGIHPAVLSDRGLPAALEGLTGRSPVPVELAAVPGDRLPRPVEAAAYFVVAEALTNVARYAHASHAVVRVERRNGTAVVEVADDGVGGADPGAGTGLRGLADRVGALDGRLSVESPAGRGTLVRAEIPCGS